MTRLLTALAAAIVIAVAGFFGFELYVQHRAAAGVEAMFEQIRAAGGKASHGEVAFDPWTRTLTVADITGESAAQPPVTVRIANFTATGINQADSTRLTTSSIEARDVEIGARMVAQGDWQVTYKLPRIAMKDYSGPTALKPHPALSSVMDIYRFAADLFADIAASSVTAPSVTFTMTAGPVLQAEGSYSDFAMEGVKGGKVAVMKNDKFTFTVNTQQAGKANKTSGKIENFTINDIDITAAATTLDPSKADDDRYYRVYGHISAGAYDVTSSEGANTHLANIAVDDVGVRPSRMQLASILAMMPKPGAAPTPAEAREMSEKVARLYEGIRVGDCKINGVSIEVPRDPVGPVKMSALRWNMQDGKAELAIDGLDTTTPNGAFKVEHFALKALDIPNLLRMAALSADPARALSPGLAAIQSLSALEGLEIKGVVAPVGDGKKQLKIDTVILNWGQFVDSIPTRSHLLARLATPLDASNPVMQPLIMAGIDTAAIDVDLDAAWTEASQTFVLNARKGDIGSLLAASARISLAKVPRAAFSINPQQSIAAGAQIEAGELELSLHDLGVVDFLIAQFARRQNLSREAARQAIIDTIRSGGDKAAAANSDAAAAMEALVRFIETPGQTLIVKLTPVGRVPALPLLQLMKTDPFSALAPFKIEASTGL